MALVDETRSLVITDTVLIARLWDLSFGLAVAANLHRTEGCQRVGVMSAAAGVIDFLRALEFPADQIEPLHHIFQDLSDLEDGKRPSKLVCPDQKNRNAAKGSSYWKVRAALRSAMEIRRRLDGDISLSIAAERVASDIPSAYDRLRMGSDPTFHADERGKVADLTEKLITLRKTIDDQRYPNDSCVLAFVETTNGLLKNIPDDDRGAQLNAAYSGMRAMITRLLATTA